MSASVNYVPIVDTHAHLNLEEYGTELDSLIQRSRLGRFPQIKGRQIDVSQIHPFVASVVCPGIDLVTSLKAISLAQQYDLIFAAVGFHPNRTNELKKEDWNKFKELVLNSPRKNKIVAIGEIGLDLYWDYSPLSTQRQVLLQELELAAQTQLPIIVHSRDSEDELIQTFRDFYGAEAKKPSALRGVVHSFNGTLEQAEELLEMGFYLGFGGFVTYENKKFAQLWEIAKKTPLDRMLLETDCPFLTPHPLRGKVENNEPLLAVFAAKRLADLRNVSVSEIAEQTRQNAATLFQLPDVPIEPH